MNRIKKFSASIILLLIYVVVVFYLALVVPANASIPIHWNAQGQIDGYASKTTAVITALALNFGLFILLYLMPFYSPKYKQQAARFDKVLPKIVFMLLIFFSILNIYMLAYPLITIELPLNPVLIIIGLMLAVLGNLLPKVPRNFFVGIRTPWTISDEDNWHKTHRLGGRLFLIGGLLLAISGLIPLSARFSGIVFWIIMIIILFPALYSFILYRRSR